MFKNKVNLFLLMGLLILFFSGCSIGDYSSPEDLEVQKLSENVSAGENGSDSKATYRTVTLSAEQHSRVFSVYPTSTAPTVNFFAAQAWTWSGTPGTVRSLIKFNLNSIPSNATITGATLRLYHHPSIEQSSLTKSNASYLERVVSSWSPAGANWNNQPSVTTTNRVYLAKSTSPTQNYVLNVTGMVNDMRRYGNNGMRLRLATESYYAQMYFASANHPDSSLHPKLVISYSVPAATTVILNPMQSTRAFSVDPTSTAPSVDYFAAQAWTWSGRPGSVRSFMKFNLATIPAGAVINSATLRLFHHPRVEQSSLTKSNAAYLERVTGYWSPYSLCWNQQPSTTITNRVYLPKSTSATQDYTLNVTGLIRDMQTYGNNGMRLSLASESYYAQMYFASGNYATASLRPQLIVSYTY